MKLWLTFPQYSWVVRRCDTVGWLLHYKKMKKKMFVKFPVMLIRRKAWFSYVVNIGDDHCLWVLMSFVNFLFEWSLTMTRRSSRYENQALWKDIAYLPSPPAVIDTLWNTLTSMSVLFKLKIITFVYQNYVLLLILIWRNTQLAPHCMSEYNSSHITWTIQFQSYQQCFFRFSNKNFDISVMQQWTGPSGIQFLA